MKFIKKHLSAIIAIIVFILVVVGLFLMKDFFLPTETKVIYGNRLEGIEKVKITEEKKNAVKTALQEETASVTVRVAGRIIYIDIKANGEVSQEAAKAFGPKVLEVFSDEEKNYYDIQFLIENDTNPGQFTILGYKHHTKGDISWTRDRTES